MGDAQDAINSAIGELDNAAKAIRSRGSRQVTASEEKDFLESLVYAWTRSHRPIVATGNQYADLSPTDRAYDTILKATSKSASRVTYRDALKEAKRSLVLLRSTPAPKQSARGASVRRKSPEFRAPRGGPKHATHPRPQVGGMPKVHQRGGRIWQLP